MKRAREQRGSHAMDPEPASDPDEEPPNWQCTACSFSNYGALNECEMCGTGRPEEGWYSSELEGQLSNATIVEQVRQITACDTETAVRGRKPHTESPARASAHVHACAQVGAMLHMSKLAKLENGQPPPKLGEFEAEHIQIVVAIVMDPLKWMPNPGDRLQADGSRTPSTLRVNGEAAMMNGEVLL